MKCNSFRSIAAARSVFHCRRHPASGTDAKPPVRPEVPKVLAIVSESRCRSELKAIADEMGWEMKTIENPAAIASSDTEEMFGVILYRPEQNECFWEEVTRLSRLSPHPSVVLLSEDAGSSACDEVARHGASDILRVPLERRAVIHTVRWAWSLWRSRHTLRSARAEP